MLIVVVARPRMSRAYPRPARASREEAREQRLAGNVQRHRERGAQPPRRDRGLSRAEIVATAIAVADAEGPEAISMRRIARELRAGPMSLYWHVGSKEELLDLMLESIEAEVEAPEPSGDWRADLRAFARRTRAGMLTHRWAMEFLGGRPPSGPNDARNLERLLGVLDGLGLDARTTMDILSTVATYVMGAVIREAQEIRGQRDRELAEENLAEEEIAAEHERYRKWFEASGQYRTSRGFWTRTSTQTTRKPGKSALSSAWTACSTASPPGCRPAGPGRSLKLTGWRKR